MHMTNLELAILNILYKGLNEKELLTINYIEKFQSREIESILQNNLDMLKSWDYLLYYLILNRYKNLDEAEYFINWNDHCTWTITSTKTKCVVIVELDKDSDLYDTNYNREDLKDFLLYNSFILPKEFELTIIEE